MLLRILGRTLKNSFYHHYFLLRGRNALFPHFLHLTLPFNIFCGSAFILLWQFLHTKTFLKSLFIASGIFAMIIDILFNINLNLSYYIYLTFLSLLTFICTCPYNFLFITFLPSISQYSTVSPETTSAFRSSGTSISRVSKP